MKKIKFYSALPHFNLPEPGPASKKIPNWYRDLSNVNDGVETVKQCIPFLDSMLGGYNITLPADVYVSEDSIETNASIPIIETHLKSQVEGFPLPEEFRDQPFKWINNFIVETPKGYSTLFVHPINQPNLPFYSMGGIVDTDKYPVPVNFPFFIKKGFEGIIKQDTPIIQAIPFKREDWEMSVDEMKKYHMPIEFDNERMSPPFNYYKRKFWSRKRYS